MGLQSLAYYATLSWFPTMFRDHGISATAAGNLLALMNVGNAITGLIVPVLAPAGRATSARWWLVAVTLITIGLAGSAFGPNATAVIFVLRARPRPGQRRSGSASSCSPPGSGQPGGRRAVRVRPGRRVPDRQRRAAAARAPAHRDRRLDDPECSVLLAWSAGSWQQACWPAAPGRSARTFPVPDPGPLTS